ncbi:hypothetical protein [Microbulbifer epialgicus]|uniref:Lumazine-binding n=1 Tax=Microbulbifer epialgicus TaxID=393907 RepID=A0ABV4NWV5_9GAMM
MNTLARLAALLLCTSLNTYAETSAEDHIAKFIDNFSSETIEGSAANYFIETPHFIFGPKVFSPQGATEVEVILSDIRTALKERDYVKSEVMSFETQFTGENMSIISVLLKRYTSKNSILDYICNTYTLANTKEGWKILSWLPSDPVNSTQCFNNNTY